MPIELLKAYAKRIRELRQANKDVSEPALAPEFKQLLDDCARLLASGHSLVSVPEFNSPGIGRPDIALMRTGTPPRAFIELKAPSKPSDPTRWRDHDKRQYERFKDLPNWAICNFYEFRLFSRSEETGFAFILPETALKPDTPDAKADRAIEAHDTAPFMRVLNELLMAAGVEPAARDAEHLAELMAHSARLVRAIIYERLQELGAETTPLDPLHVVRREFREVLYAHPEAGGYSNTDFDDLFAAAFAQTLAFGLLLVRESSGQNVSETAWTQMPETHPLMRTALRVLTLPEVVGVIGVGWDVIRDTVNSFSNHILALKPDGADPILYFYEHFLKVFDPEAREKYGVYYTPVEVVRYMAGALDRALRRPGFGLQGLVDERVTILDPATGTGTFLLGIADRVWAQTEGGAGFRRAAIRSLATRMFAFELLVGPYAVAHYRLHHALKSKAEENSPDQQPFVLPRLGIYLADTLAEPGAAAPAGPLGFVSAGITEERREANRIKTEQPILAIIGNPPYRRLQEGENRTLVGDWMDHLWSDLKEPVSLAGQGGQLNTFPELSVAFWRLAIWKLFEADGAPQRGVIAYITNRKFLTGWPYAGLRQMMRERFDRIEIIDLRGDVRRGTRGDVDADQGVFNIQVGTAITIAIADGSKEEGALAEVIYSDSWANGQFDRQSKLNWLLAADEANQMPESLSVDRTLLDDFRPKPFQAGEWISIRDCFKFNRSGIQTKRDGFIYSANRRTLESRLQLFHNQTDPALNALFHPTDAKPLNNAIDEPLVNSNFQLFGYRPFDNRWIYNSERLIDRARPELQAAWGNDNISLYTMPGGIGAGPAVWCHGLRPDYHAFRGSYGGYAFPLYDRRPAIGTHNLSPALMSGLAASYGAAITPEDVFNVMLCLLTATSYTKRFSEDLEDVFPHLVFPADHAIFVEASRIGALIRAVETFAPIANPHLRAGFVELSDEPVGAIEASDMIDGAMTLCANGSGRYTGIPIEVWRFEVSGYRALPNWLSGRKGLPATSEIAREFRDICGRIAMLLDLACQADTLLDEALRHPLTRAALGQINTVTADNG